MLVLSVSDTKRHMHSYCWPDIYSEVLALCLSDGPAGICDLTADITRLKCCRGACQEDVLQEQGCLTQGHRSIDMLRSKLAVALLA